MHTGIAHGSTLWGLKFVRRCFFQVKLTVYKNKLEIHSLNYEGWQKVAINLGKKIKYVI